LRLKTRREALHQLERRLNSLGPEQVLSRGYSITMDATTGTVLRDAKKAKKGQRLRTRLHHGELASQIVE
jgi:exodeoxyribonuclease VII large subunit